MSPLHSRTIMTVLTGLLVSAGLLVGAVFFALHLRLPPDIASLLPADATVLLARHATIQDLHTMIGDVPLLSSAPALPGRMTVAIVRQPNGTQQWMVVPEEFQTVPAASLQALGKLSVLSSQDISWIPASVDHPLSDDPMYQRLTNGTDTSTLQIYTFSPTPPVGATGLISATLLRSQAMLLTRSDSTLHLRAFLPEVRLPENAVSVTLSSLPQVTWSVAAANPPTVQWLLQSLDPVAADGKRGQWEARIQDLLGSNVSLTYDLLPLFARAPSMYTAPTTSGRSAPLLLAGEADPHVNVGQQLSVLRTRMRAASTATVDRRVYEDEYVSDLVRSTGAQQGIDERSGPWHITGFETSASGAGLYVASAGRRVVIATDRAWMDAFLTTDKPLVLPTVHGQLLLAGSLDASALSPFLAPTDPLPIPSLVAQFLTSTHRVTWALGAQAQVVDFALTNPDRKAQEAPPQAH